MEVVGCSVRFLFISHHRETAINFCTILNSLKLHRWHHFYKKLGHVSILVFGTRIVLKVFDVPLLPISLCKCKVNVAFSSFRVRWIFGEDFKSCFPSPERSSSLPCFFLGTRAFLVQNYEPMPDLQRKCFYFLLSQVIFREMGPCFAKRFLSVLFYRFLSFITFKYVLSLWK